MIRGNYERENFKLFIIVFLIAFVDQLSKIIVETNLISTESITIIPNFLNITLLHNFGAAFGILSDMDGIIIAFSLGVLIFLFFEIKKYYNNVFIFNVIAVLIGGILGNLIDRIIHGYIIDFIEFKLFSLNLPIFNVSDTCIVVSTILLIIVLFSSEEKNGKNNL